MYLVLEFDTPKRLEEYHKSFHILNPNKIYIFIFFPTFLVDVACIDMEEGNGGILIIIKRLLQSMGMLLDGVKAAFERR